MKKMLVWLLLPLLLTGCGQPEDFETMSDVYETPELPPAEQVTVYFPPEAAMTVMETTDGAKLYLCDGYSIAVQTFQSGDLKRTLREVTGYDDEKLLVMERKQGELPRYECAWTAAGEGGDQVGRTVVLDDGTYHYTLTLMTHAEDAGKLSDIWQDILDSFKLGVEEPGKG